MKPISWHPPWFHGILLLMSDPISRLNAALEGRYCIERELGEGGMATVYLAHDLRRLDAQFPTL